MMTLAERWNGSAWTTQSTPNPAGGSHLASVSCSSATACTAVGYRQPVAVGWDGTTWMLQNVPAPQRSAGIALVGTSCTSSAACTAVGVSSPGDAYNPLIERWNGTAWTVQKQPGARRVSLRRVVQLGHRLPRGGQLRHPPSFAYQALALRWDGTTWTKETISLPPQVPSGLLGIACAPASPCSAVGYSGMQTLAERSSS